MLRRCAGSCGHPAAPSGKAGGASPCFNRHLFVIFSGQRFFVAQNPRNARCSAASGEAGTQSAEGDCVGCGKNRAQHGFDPGGRGAKRADRSCPTGQGVIRRIAPYPLYSMESVVQQGFPRVIVLPRRRLRPWHPGAAAWPHLISKDACTGCRPVCIQESRAPASFRGARTPIPQVSERSLF